MDPQVERRFGEMGWAVVEVEPAWSAPNMPQRTLAGHCRGARAQLEKSVEDVSSNKRTSPQIWSNWNPEAPTDRGARLCGSPGLAYTFDHARAQVPDLC